MLKINKEVDGNNVTLTLEGSLDTATAPDLEVEITGFIEILNVE